jgi:hypothetical protein
LYARARKAFDKAPRLSPPDLSADFFERPLYILMQALEDEAPVVGGTALQLLARTLEHEMVYWEKYWGDDARKMPNVCNSLVPLVTLAGTGSLESVSPVVSSFLHWLKADCIESASQTFLTTLYSRAANDSVQISALEPDLLGELLALSWLGGLQRAETPRSLKSFKSKTGKDPLDILDSFNSKQLENVLVVFGSCSV